MARFIDTFTDVDGTLLQNHTPDNADFVWTKRDTFDIYIENNHLESNTTSAASSRYTADGIDTWDPIRQEFIATVPVLKAAVIPDTFGVGLILYQDPVVQNGYRLITSFSGAGIIFAIGRLTAGGFVTLLNTGNLALPADGVHDLEFAYRPSDGRLRFDFGGIHSDEVSGEFTYSSPSGFGIEQDSTLDQWVIMGLVAGEEDEPEPEPEPPEECFPTDDIVDVADPAVATFDCVDSAPIPSILVPSILYEITPGDECIPEGVVAAACWEVGDGTQVGSGAGICAVAEGVCTTVLSDNLEDSAGTLLEDHVPDSPTPFSWFNAGSGSLTIRSGNKIRAGASGTEFYRADEPVGVDCCVSHYAKHFESVHQNAIAGVSCRHTAVDSIEGIYFGVRSDTPSNCVRLFGWDAVGDDLFPELEGTLPDDAVDALAHYQVVCEGTTVRGYVNGELILEQTGVPTMLGEFVGLVGGWSDNGVMGSEDLYTSGPFAAGTFG